MIPKRPDRKECLDDLGFRVYRTEVIAHEHAVAKVAVEALRELVEVWGTAREALAKIEQSDWKP